MPCKLPLSRPRWKSSHLAGWKTIYHRRMDMTLHVVAKFRVAEGKRDQVFAVLREAVPPTLEEEGCIEYRPYIDPSDDSYVVLVELWRSKEDLDLHFQTPHLQKIGPALDGLLTEPPTILKLVEA
ncbi:antibiotic biosynthesis monooxygenase [Pseudonocardiaceae bacterium YIM PH 21723]|nr:antibiotic biosynthesis monooxygenase [Pseudonocardiaceae bacterium YIM PH 21723]